MNDGNGSLPNDNIEGICPYLGLARDRETRYGYPDLENYCYRVKSPQPVSYEHQELVCFTAEYLQCPVYHSEGKKPFPSEIRGEGLPSRLERGFSWGWVVLGVVGLAVIAAVFLLDGHLSSSPTLTPFEEIDVPLITTVSATEESSIELVLETPVPTKTLIPTASLTPTISLTPTMTPTITPTQGPGLGTPFGIEEKFIVYQAKKGESLGNIAYEYNTSVEAIRVASNLKIGKAVWPGDLLVIPVGQSDESQIPHFYPLNLDTKTDIYKLANRYGISASDIRRYNGLGNSDLIPAGRWLIIPVSGE